VVRCGPLFFEAAQRARIPDPSYASRRCGKLGPTMTFEETSSHRLNKSKVNNEEFPGGLMR
jgi:hypothetical protein